MTISLLVLEDEESQFVLLEDALKEINAKGDDAIIMEHAVDAQSALALFASRKFDGAILDLRVPQDAATKASEPVGVEIALHAIEQHGLPIVIVSGFLGEIEDKLDAYPMTLLVKKNDKYAFEKALGFFVDHKPMLQALGNARTAISQSLANTFSRWIWPHWQSLMQATDEDQVQLNSVVTRQLVSHMAELLGVDTEENPDWHPLECYIRPVLYEHRAQTGDIFAYDDGSIWIVLTPQCDMATGKVPSVILAKCEHGQFKDWDNKKGDLSSEVEKKRNSAQKNIRGLTNQNLSLSLHFLPPIDDKGPLAVLFGHLQTIPLDELNGCLDKRVASLAATFVPNLTQRFGAFISRTGQPNLDPGHF